MLAKELKGTVVQENFSDNPYLELYYTELQKNIKPNKYAIGSQLFFLKETYDVHQKTSDAEIQIFDRSMHENISVFGESLISMGLMSELDAQLYRRIANDYLNRFKGYDIFVYLRTDEETLLKRIQQRGREMEKSSIDAEYLSRLNKLYEVMFEALKKEEENLIVIDTTDLSETDTLNYLTKQLNRRYSL